ncbi:hypothetical protein [Pontibacter beigongshangensis]|nr:hypothetical protein [Pontibacter beigongshangensis]
MDWRHKTAVFYSEGYWKETSAKLAETTSNVEQQHAATSGNNV